MTQVLPHYYAAWGEESDSHAGDANFIAFVNGDAIPAGLMHNSNRNYIRNPGDSASQVTQTSANLQFYFQSPVSGLLRIVATLRGGHSGSDIGGTMIDESGWTNASITQESTLSMWIPGVIDGNFSSYTLASYSRGDNDGNWYYRIIHGGEIRQYQHIPNNTFTAGQWVLMQLTIFDKQHAWVNDMEFSGEIWGNWAIERLDVTGA